MLKSNPMRPTPTTHRTSFLADTEVTFVWLEAFGTDAVRRGKLTTAIDKTSQARGTNGREKAYKMSNQESRRRMRKAVKCSQAGKTKTEAYASMNED